MESMTGYAFIEKSTDEFSFSIELKSLNSKYLETFINIPKIIRYQENDIQQLLKKYFSRGKIELNLDIFDWTVNKNISLNHELIKKYFRELKKIQRDMGINQPVTLDSVLKLDGVSQRERSVISDKSLKDVYKTIEAAAKKTIEMRKKEGNATKKDIVASINAIYKSVEAIKQRVKPIADNKVKELKERIDKISQKNIDDSRLFSEIAILADKLDINEELVRLNDHIAKFKAIIKVNDQIGRKLDFLAQEMFREINTIASKSNSSEISHIVVDVKNYIDKIREQCRNIV
ncbi:MAG TPA: YicC family protein [Spirochaetota bacterium]|nr:YicC family protein [Spirochaetota bacterium]HPI88591.1 YicC family protein [Spirochaetota bacterium]HPR48232.1 YicC family protein [Spirochaetota bacterium]